MYKLLEKLKNRNDAAKEHEGACVVFLGDSVTHGCFEVFFDGEKYHPVFDEEHSYTAIFRRMVKTLYPVAQLNVVNSGISGDTAPKGLKRLERDVIAHQPDLVVVCFGLNDCNAGPDGIETYKTALSEIVQRIKAAGSDVIVMTPSATTDSVLYTLRTDRERADAQRLAAYTVDGTVDRYMDAARAVAAECGIALVDCYALWQKFAAAGVTINDILSNKINHPIRELHLVFAYELLREVFSRV